ncbi:MAG TPA: protein kinase [Drouetiella sp.]
MTPSDSNRKSSRSDATEKSLAGAQYKKDDILGGRYRVISLLGRGGMGIVYRVEQIYLGKELALKTIDRQFMTDITIRRFKTEARAAFAVDHANIIGVHDFGLFEDETPFLVMEIAEGETLGDRLKRGPLSIEESVPIFVQTCFGLAHAHECGVIHRDIKPNNIMLLNKVPDGIDVGVKILDFGIAKLAHEGGEIQALTRTGEIFGSPFYMSPEQCSGEPVDHRTDVYSLGCVIFESLTGRPPFVGENALATMMLHQMAPIPSLKEATKGGDFAPGLNELVATMLAKNPNDRYQNLGTAALDLGSFKRGAPAELGAEIKFKRSAASDERKRTVTLKTRTFYSALAAVGIVTFTVSSLLTYMTQAANFILPTATPSINSSAETANGDANKVATGKLGADATGVTNANETKNQSAKGSDNATLTESGDASTKQSSNATTTEDSIIFQSAVMKGANTFKSKYASDASLKIFKNYKLAQVVNLQNGKFSDTGLGNLSDSKVLTLSLSNCILDKLDNIVKLRWLQTLDLTNTKITDAAMPVLARLKMLHFLTLTGCNISEEGLRQLSKSNSITVVFLTPKKYSDKFINELSEKMPSCVFIPYMKRSRLFNLGESEKSKERATVLSKLISIAEKANPNHSSIGTMWLELAFLQDQRRHYKESRAFVDKTVALLERNGDYPMLSTPLFMQSNSVAVMDKNSKKAIELINRAEQIYVDCNIHNSDKQMLTTLRNMTLVPIALGVFDPAIEYCKTGLSFIEKYPSRDGNTMLPEFLEKIGWLYCAEKKPDQARPYFKRAVDITSEQREKDPKPYLRVLIEYAHTLTSTSDFKTRKALYIEAMGSLEKLGLPEDLNLREHYFDACGSISNILAAEGDHSASTKYLMKGLEAMREFHQPYIPARKAAFSKLLVAELKAAGRTKEAEKVAAQYGVKP